MSKTVLIGIIGIISVIGIFAFFSLNKTKSQNPLPTQQQETTQSIQSAPGYSGKVIAGSQSPFLEFNKVDYEKAKSEGKIIFLDFFANWCPVCRAEAPTIHSGFDNLQSNKVVGFRVNFNDDETNEDEKALAKEFNVPYQYTKIILKDGKEVSRSGTKWEKADFDSAFSKVL